MERISWTEKKANEKKKYIYIGTKFETDKRNNEEHKNQTLKVDGYIKRYIKKKVMKTALKGKSEGKKTAERTTTIQMDE